MGWVGWGLRPVGRGEEVGGVGGQGHLLRNLGAGAEAVTLVHGWAEILRGAAGLRAR